MSGTTNTPSLTHDLIRSIETLHLLGRPHLALRLEYWLAEYQKARFLHTFKTALKFDL